VRLRKPVRYFFGKYRIVLNNQNFHL